ncbi:LIM-domain binding protein-domain-containing protein [Lenzites betulinus]|nr:LIM-domain binding protein-domain-containing protein [Lenzites betulinus]
MNVQHPDMLRQGVPTMHQNLINQPFFPQQQQGQPSSAHNMGPFQNAQGNNPGLGLMGGQPGASNAGYPLNMPPGPPSRRPANMFMGPHPGAPAPSSLNPAGGGGPSHMSGLGPAQLQNMSGFPAGMMAGQPTIRRVQSQPMNPNGAHMSGMQPGMMAGGMNLNGPPSMAASRASMSAAQQQQQQMQLHLRQQQAQLQAQGGAMSPEMGLPMSRPAHMQGGGPMPPHARNASGQPLMPTSMPQHGMQQQMAHNGYSNAMSLQHQHQHQQSQLGTSPHSMGGNQLSPQATGNRAQMTPDNSMFMGFPNQPIQPPILHGVPRPPMGGSQFNVTFNPSPTPPNQGVDMSQRGNAAMNPGGPATQSLITPAQALDKMNAGAENFPAGSYGMGQPQMNVPARPPSQHSPHNHNPFPIPQSQQPHPSQQSPRQADRLTGQMPPPGGMLQRPQSQPQVAHRQSPIPPGPSRTPHVSQTPLPMNAQGGIPQGRIPGPGQSPQGPAHQQVQQPGVAPPSAHPTQIAPRPPSAAAAASARAGPPQSAHPAPANQPGPENGQTSQAASSTSAPPPAPAPVPATAQAPAAAARAPIYPVGFGQAVCRILQLSGSLGVDHKDRLKQSYWDQIVAGFFTEKATMKLTLWKDNQQIEAKPFEIGFPILPRFFLVTSQSGVKSMTINIDGARERLASPSHALVECANASWTFRYQNGYHITLRGPLTADVIVQPHTPPGHPSNTSPGVAPYTLKLDRLQFDAFWHDKYVALDSIVGERIPESPRGLPPSPGMLGAQNDDPNRFDEAKYIIEHAIVPAEPINAFGIPQATMRCLELAESVAQMSELIQFSKDADLGPVDALAKFAEKLRAARMMSRAVPMTGLGGPVPPYHVESSSAFEGHGMNGINGAVSNASNAIAGPSSGPAGGDPSQRPAQPDAMDVKQGKGTPQASQASGSTPAASASTPASAPTPGGPTTPSMANATLKRKAPQGGRAGDDSPTTANAEQAPPAKRVARKRGRTQGS